MNSRSILNAGLWQLINVSLAAIIQFSYYGYLARVLPKSDFGLLALANVFINFAMFVTEGGLGTALIQRREVNQGHISIVMFSNILIAIVLYIIYYFSSGAIANFFNSADLAPILKILSLNFIIQAFGSVSYNMSIKRMEFKKICIIETAANFLSAVMGIILAWKGMAILGAVYSILFRSFIRAACYIAANKKNVFVFSAMSKQHFNDLYSFGIGMTLIRFNNYLNSFGFQSMIGKVVPLSALGIFERSYRIMIMPASYLGGIVDRVMFPGMSKFNDDDEKLYNYGKKMLRIVNIIMIPSTALFILYANEIVALLLGNKWTDAVFPLRILFLSLPFRISVMMCDSVVRAKGKVYQAAYRKFLYTLVLFLSVGMASHWGIIGICLATSGAAIFNYFNMLSLVKKLFKADFTIFSDPFIEPLKLVFFVLLLTVPVYFFVSSFSGFYFTPFLTSFLLLIITIFLIFKIKPYVFGETVNWFIGRLNLYNKNK
ncbi:MAG: lipopolysaccharide biosynthesis protein [Ferruginibacter sp.]